MKSSWASRRPQRRDAICLDLKDGGLPWVGWRPGAAARQTLGCGMSIPLRAQSVLSGCDLGTEVGR